MKKKLLLAGATMLVAAAVVTGYSAYSKSNVSDLLSANVEALTRGESGDKAEDCYKDGTPPYGAYGGYHTCNNCKTDADLVYGFLGNPCDRPF